MKIVFDECSFIEKMAEIDFKFGNITRKIIKSGYSVHDYFGFGFPEIAYKRAQIIEMQLMGLSCLCEVEKPIYYRDQLIYKRKVDLIVEDKVLVEIKAIQQIEPADINQILNYLTIFKFEVGLLINFGQKRFLFQEVCK